MSSRGTLRSGVHSNATATGGGLVASISTAVYRACAVAVWAALLAGCDRPPAPAPSVRVRETRRLMGVPWTITLYASSAAAGTEACAAAFAEVARLERILSDYDPTSELSRLSAAAPTAEPVAVGPDLWRVLVRAVEFRDATGGAFDVTVGPLTTLWRQARRTGRMPRPERLDEARRAVGAGALALLPGRRAVSLPRAGTRLDLGGIGMGDAADRALEVLGRRGIEAALIDASGDVVASGPPPGAAAWRIELAPLGSTAADRGGDTIELVRAAVTTSGDAFQAVEIDGVRYGHIVDPRTGLGVRGPLAVTVIARDCTTADAMATAACVLGPDEGLRLVESVPGAAAAFQWLEDGRLRRQTSSRWPSGSVSP